MDRAGERGGDAGAPSHSGPAVPVGGGVPVDPATGERFGYLPRKAAQRKIIIRRTLGLPWVLGAVGAALLIAIAGTGFLLSRPGRPAARYADEGALAAYRQGAVTPLRSGVGWLDRRESLVVWLTGEPFCPSDGGFGAGAQRWDRHGAAASRATENLRYADAQVSNGRVYVDRHRSHVAAGPGGPALPGCARPQPLSR